MFTVVKNAIAIFLSVRGIAKRMPPFCIACGFYNWCNSIVQIVRSPRNLCTMFELIYCLQKETFLGATMPQSMLKKYFHTHEPWIQWCTHTQNDACPFFQILVIFKAAWYCILYEFVIIILLVTKAIPLTITYFTQFSYALGMTKWKK